MGYIRFLINLARALREVFVRAKSAKARAVRADFSRHLQIGQNEGGIGKLLAIDEFPFAHHVFNCAHTIVEQMNRVGHPDFSECVFY